MKWFICSPSFSSRFDRQGELWLAPARGTSVKLPIEVLIFG
jgi:hypothetical protein